MGGYTNAYGGCKKGGGRLLEGDIFSGTYGTSLVPRPSHKKKGVVTFLVVPSILKKQMLYHAS